MKYISHVASNVKRGVDCDLFPKTLIVGRRGTGKSAVVNTVELALTGRASGIAGRDVSREVELLALAPPAEDLTATVHFVEELVGGAVSPVGAADFCVGRTATGAKKAVHHIPSNVDGQTLVLRPVMDALLGSPETARKFLLAHTGGAVTHADIAARIPPALRDHYQRALATCTPHAAPTDALLEVLAAAAKTMREAMRRAKAAGAVLESAGRGLAPQPTAQARWDAASALTDARAALETAARAEAAAVVTETQRQRLEQQLAETSTRLAAADDERQAIVGEIRRLPADAAQPPDPVLVAILAALEVNLSRSPGECLCCGAATSTDALRVRRDAIAAATQLRISLNAAFQALAVRHEAVLAEWKRWMAEETQLKAALHALPTAAPADTAPLRTAALKAEQRHIELQQASAAWETIDHAQDEQRAAERDAAAWKGVVDACTTAVRELLDVHVDAFVARVQRHLPSGWTFTLHLHDGERETFRIGIVRDGQTITALSGGEWATLTAAVAAACAPNDTDLSVVIPDDCSIDAVSLTETLAAFSDCASQVIVTSAIAPASVPAGWHVIDTDRGEHRTTTAAGDTTAKKTRGRRKVA